MKKILRIFTMKPLAFLNLHECNVEIVQICLRLTCNNGQNIDAFFVGLCEEQITLLISSVFIVEE